MPRYEAVMELSKYVDLDNRDTLLEKLFHGPGWTGDPGTRQLTIEWTDDGEVCVYVPGASGEGWFLCGY